MDAACPLDVSGQRVEQPVDRAVGLLHIESRAGVPKIIGQAARNTEHKQSSLRGAARMPGELSLQRIHAIFHRILRGPEFQTVVRDQSSVELPRKLGCDMGGVRIGYALVKHAVGPSLHCSEFVIMYRYQDEISTSTGNRYSVMINAVQCKMARAAVGWGVRDLAKEAGVSVDTVSRLERGEELMPRTVAAIRTALEAAGVTFLESGDVAGGPGVALRDRT